MVDPLQQVTRKLKRVKPAETSILFAILGFIDLIWIFCLGGGFIVDIAGYAEWSGFAVFLWWLWWLTPLPLFVFGIYFAKEGLPAARIQPLVGLLLNGLGILLGYGCPLSFILLFNLIS